MGIFVKTEDDNGRRVVDEEANWLKEKEKIALRSEEVSTDSREAGKKKQERRLSCYLKSLFISFLCICFLYFFSLKVFLNMFLLNLPFFYNFPYLLKFF